MRAPGPSTHLAASPRGPVPARCLLRGVVPASFAACCPPAIFAGGAPTLAQPRVVPTNGFSEEELSIRFAGKHPAGFPQKPYGAADRLSVLARWGEAEKRPHMDLLERFRQHLATLPIPAGPALVAVSGGGDSVTLLHLLLESGERDRRELVVAHFDHGIHSESAAVAERVRVMAEQAALPFALGRGHLGPATRETAAREARLNFLARAREQWGAGSIILAHHADDQAETVLMRTLAGSGPAGLACMEGVSGCLVRPLLPYRRSELAQYLQDHALDVWDDPSNSDERHLRAWLRTRVLPMLRERLPSVEVGLLDLARQSRRNRTAWDALLGSLPELDVRPEMDGISVAVGGVLGYDSSLAEALMFALARRVGCPLGPARAQRLLEWLPAAPSGSRLQLSKSWQAEVSFGRLHMVAVSSPDSPTGVLEIGGRVGQGAWGRWRITWDRADVPPRQERVALTAWFRADALTVRGWETGERVRPLAGVGRRLIVRCFQDARIPRSRRHAWPVIVGGNEVVWIPGVCRSDALVPPSGSEALRVDAEFV